jgi:hypothetical protein
MIGALVRPCSEPWDWISAPLNAEPAGRDPIDCVAAVWSRLTFECGRVHCSIFAIAATSAYGTSRHFAATQQISRFREQSGHSASCAHRIGFMSTRPRTGQMSETIAIAATID